MVVGISLKYKEGVKMRTVIYYFSGTGNSLAVAKGLAKSLEGVVELHPIAGYVRKQSVEIDGDLVGIVFPVYFLSIPDLVRTFLKKLTFKSDPYIFAAATCNAQPGHSLYSVKRMLELKGKSLAAGFSIDMPGNAIVGKVDMTSPPEAQKERLTKAEAKLPKIVQAISERRYDVIEGNNNFTTYVQSLLMKTFIRRFYRPAKRFQVAGNCNHCGVCAMVCPLKNISLDLEQRPIWGSRCETCLACFHWCPERAINMEKDTIGKARYHHPEVTIEEMVIP